jgi:hypothetical protein
MNGLARGLLGVAVWSVSSAAWAQNAPFAQVEAAAPWSAEESPVAAAPQVREETTTPKKRWYGWQSLAVDGGAVLMAFTALKLDESRGATDSNAPTGELLLGSAAAYGLVAPTIHLLHDNGWRALGSFGLRATLPVAVGALGRALATCPPPNGEYGNCGLGEVVIGAGVGAVLAMVVDDAVLAWDVPREDSKGGTTRVGLAPVVATEGRRELRLYGTF